MNKYLLLRSNKQTGPYSLEEIRAMGLKAYDLVWVEGKSAAWRYPGEIEELKAFAPLVEEQPFDRFFKKPVQEGQSHSISDDHRYAPVASDHASVNQSNGNVYVNLPAEKKEAAKEKESPVYAESQQPAKEKLVVRETIIWEPVQKTFAQSLSSTTREPVGLEENYSQSLDDIKREYAEKVLGRKKNHKVNIRRYIQPVAVGLIMVALLACGVFIGLTISRGRNSTKNDLSKEQNGVSEQQSLYPTKTIPISSSLPAKPTDKNLDNNLPRPDQSANNNTADIIKGPVVTENKKKAQKQKITDSLRAQKAIATKTDSGALVAQNDVAHNKPDPLATEKENIKNNIEDYVTVGGNKYSVGTFGGISDLQLTVSNTSPYPLDLVVVEVQYVQSNKKIFKRENMYFRNIGAGSALMQEAPKSPRGIKVVYRITMINAKDAGISFSDI